MQRLDLASSLTCKEAIMKSYTRRSFLKLCVLALPALSLLSKIPIPRRREEKTFFVESSKGRDYYSGTAKAPFQTIDHALQEAGKLQGPENRIYLLPGEHTITKPIEGGTTLIGMNDGSSRPAFINCHENPK